MSKVSGFIAAILFLWAIPGASAAIVGPQTYTVTNRSDAGAGSLRQAIIDANAHLNFVQVPDRIHFAITLSVPLPFPVITPTSDLPAITEGVFIDGSTQPSFGRVVINASNMSVGLVLEDGRSTVRNMCIINSQGNGLEIATPDAGTSVLGCWFGLGITGAAAGNDDAGIIISGPGNLIGGLASNERNVISSNGRGIEIEGASAEANVIRNNYIGVGIDGLAIRGNFTSGLTIADGADQTVVGGASPESRNVISANNSSILLSDSSSCEILGNWFGLDASGEALGNDEGIIVNFAHGLRIGGANPGEGNVFGPHNNAMSVSNSSGARIEGNLVGLDPTGLLPRGSDSGILVAAGVPQPIPTVVGGTLPGSRNIVCANGDGITLFGDAITVQGNWVGINASGEPVGNTDTGIEINDNNCLIGGTEPGARNVISGNADNGIEIRGGGEGNQILGNYIGTDPSGTAPIPNESDGVRITDDGERNQIGSGEPGAGNLISGNAGSAIEIGIAASGENVIQGNRLGTDVTGLLPIFNIGAGVTCLADRVIIGGTASGEGNLIGGNLGEGIHIESNSNVIFNNTIGVGVDGVTPLPNLRGVILSSAAANNTIGGVGPGEPNVIAHNEDNGVHLDALTAGGNRIRGNRIFENGGLGIEINPVGENENDDQDVDGGPNNRQNTPEIGTASSRPGLVDFIANLPSANNQTYEIDVYGSTTLDQDGSAEGEFYLGSLSVDQGPGSVLFSTSRPSSIEEPYLTMTATSASGDTSEFSPTLRAEFPSPEEIANFLLGQGNASDSLNFNGDSVTDAADIVERVNTP